MLRFKPTKKFNRDMKCIIKRKLDLSLMHEVVNTLLAEKPLATRHKDHALTGNYTGYREFHIIPDWLLIYMVDKENLILVASRTGSRSDLF